MKDMKYGKFGFTCRNNFFFANFHVLGLFMPKNKFRAKKNFRLSRGIAGVAGVASGRWSKFVSTISQPS
jgi:hypothetical protein